MNEYTSAVIIAIATGIFSIITLIIQKKQNKMINKIDNQTIFLKKEYELKKILESKEEEKDNIFEQIILLILRNSVSDTSPYYEKTQELLNSFEKVKNEIAEIKKEYILLNSLNQKNNEGTYGLNDD